MKKAAFYVLRYNPRPAVLIESLFVDNAREAGLWREPPFVDALAGGVARGVQAALGMPPDGAATGGGKDSGPESTVPASGSIAPGTTLYTVQVGAFAYLENARQRLTEAQQAGFSDAYIYQKQF